MSQRHPVHRRPSWAQREASYKHYMRKDLAADRWPGQDYGLENFSYDEAHLPKWQIPEDLGRRLPTPLHDSVTDWVYAGAAVCTAIERIQKLDLDGIHRGWPEKSTHHLARQASSQSSTVPGAETPPLSSPLSPTPMMPSALLSLDKISFDKLPHHSILGMESPPFTPTGSQACPTPDVPTMEKGMPPAAMPDAHALTRQLSPISMMSRDSFSTSATPVFDENAWETYTNTYKAELEDIRQHAWVRFKGCGYTIERLRIELGQNLENKAILDDFNKWWTEMKPKVHEYEEKVRELQEPSLELVKMERAAQGLCV